MGVWEMVMPSRFLLGLLLVAGLGFALGQPESPPVLAEGETSAMVKPTNDQMQPQTALKKPTAPLSSFGNFPTKKDIWDTLIFQKNYDVANMGTLGLITLNDADEAIDGGLGPIWRPDVIFRNVATAMQGKLLGVHTDIAPSGDVFWSRHISASFVGHFAFQAYPFDNQVLDIHISSFKQNNKAQKLHWLAAGASEIPAQIGRRVSHGMFSVRGVKYKTDVMPMGMGGEVQVLTLGIVLRRQVSSTIIKFVLPVAVLVLGSTLGYHVEDDKASASGRAGLGIMCVMTQLGFGIMTMNSLPKIAYITWLDWFTTFSFFFNCFALVEYGIVCYFNLNERVEEGDVWDVKARVYVPIAYLSFCFLMTIIGVFMWSSEPQLGSSL